MKKKKQDNLKLANAAGNDRNLAEHGGSSYYWYSVGDGVRLVLCLRRDNLNYDGMPNPIEGEEYTAFRENANRVFVTDPYYSSNFGQYLTDDISRITATDEFNGYSPWGQMPNTIIISLLSSAHWRTIKIDINYESREVSILFDDPYGTGKFPKRLKQAVIGSIKTNIQKLIRIVIEDDEFNLTDGAIHIEEKLQDQQGKGENSWDCGPITFSNIEDYVKFSTGQTDSVEYTIPEYSTPEQSEAVASRRQSDRERYVEIAGEEVNQQRLEEIIQQLDKETQVKVKKIQGFGKEVELETLDPFHVSMLFAILESKRLSEGKGVEDEYTKEEIKQAYLSLFGQEGKREDLRPDISQPFTSDGLRKTLHGNVYQLGLLTLAAIRAQAKELDFYLISEAKEFEKFDDLVIDYGDKITFLQAKHSSSPGKCYSKNDFCGDYENDASLAKYFDSWYRLRNSKYSKSKKETSEKTTQYIFFTNKGVEGASDLLEETRVDDDEFLFEDLGTRTYSIRQGEVRNELVDAIKANSEVVRDPSHNSSLDQIDFGTLKNEIKNVKSYLESKFKEQGGKTQKEIKVDGRSRLTKKEISLIKLVKEEEQVAKRVLGEDSRVLEWIKHVQITVNISNPIDVLVPRMTLEINDFLDEFIIKIEQPDSHDLAQIIFEELGADIATIGTREWNNALYNYMWEWFSKRSECLLRSEDFGRFVEVTESDLQRFYLLEGTRTYKEECEGGVVGSQQLVLVDGLSDFLTGKDHDSTQSIAVFEDRGGGIERQVYSVIISMDSLKDDEWSFLHLSSRNIELLSQILSGESAKFYIIDCRLEEIDERHLVQLQKICQTTVANEKKLILLINPEQEGLVGDLITKIGSSNFVEFESQPLTDEQIRDICALHNHKYVSLAGKEYRIQDIVDKKIGGMYELMSDAKYLAQIIESSHEERQEMESEMPYGIYVPNQMRRGEGYYDLSIITKGVADCYIIEDTEYRSLLNLLEDLFKGQDKIFSTSRRVEKETKFVLLRDASDIDKYQSKTIILTEKPLELGDRKYISLKAIGDGQFQVTENPGNLYLPFPESIDFSYQNEQEEFIETIISGSQLSVLMSPAGYGKTSFCRNIVETHRSLDSAFSPVWIVKVALHKLQFDTNSHPILIPFIDINYEWQRVAWERDTKVPGRICMVLDGVDEIKNIEIVKLINQWISTIPASISLLITTREYAANKLLLPTEQNSTFYKLTEYTEKQREMYVKKYIKAILKETEETENFNSFVEWVTEKIKSKINSHSSGVLGIPLESYIFCELLRPQILAHVEQNSYDIIEGSIDVLDNIDVSNVAKLYQEFILSKSRLFLEKHLGIKVENAITKGILFNLMGSYNQIIELYALIQTFDLDMQEIAKYADSINFDIAELRTLEDTGLLRVSKDGNRLNFNHETYQEFYTALAIIRGILSGKGELYEIVESLVKEHRYDPKFSFIFSIASQFSVSAGPMVPGYSVEKHLLLFWNLLGEDGDVLGTGAISLFKHCILALTSDEREMLCSKVEGKKWAKFLKAAISGYGNEYEEEQMHDEQDRLPIYSQGDDEDVDGDVDEVSTSKYYVAGEFRWLRKKGALSQKKVKLLEKEAKKHEEKWDYWALDGGIDAIGYIGQFFSKELAEYLVHRAKQWENNEWLVIQALISIYRDLDNGKDCDDARMNCFFVIKNLLEEEVWRKNEGLFSKLLYLVDVEFLRYLADDIIQLLATDVEIDEVDLSDPSSIFTPWFDIMRIILLVAEKLEYAVLIDESENKIALVKETKIEIHFGEDAASQVFASLMINLLKSRFDSSDIESCTSAISLDDIGESDLQKIEEYFFVRLKNEELFDQYFDSVKGNGEDLLCLYEKLYEYESITRHSVERYTAELKTSKATEEGDYRGPWWSLHGGIEIAGYTGIYFNQEIAEYLKLRAGFWPNNRVKVVEALKRVHDTLIGLSIVKSQEDYAIAMEAYNQCIDSFSGLEAIELDISASESKQAIVEVPGSSPAELEVEMLGNVEEPF